MVTLKKDPITRRYTLVPQIIRLSGSLLTSNPLYVSAKPFLKRLMERTGECAHLAILAQGKTLYIDQVESPATFASMSGWGRWLLCTAPRREKSCWHMAEMNCPVFLEAFTPKTITDPEVLQQHLETVRQQGFGWTTRSSIHVCVVSLSRFMIFQTR